MFSIGYFIFHSMLSVGRSMFDVRRSDPSSPSLFEADIQASQDNAAAILSRYLRTNGNREWFGHLQGLIEIVTNAPDEAAFREQALALAADLPALADEMDSTVFEGMLDLLLATETANGQAARAAELRDKE